MSKSWNPWITGAVKMPTRVVIHRGRLTPAEVAAVGSEGVYGPLPEEERICQLEVGGEVLARGRIVRRRGRCYFKVLETGGEA